MATSPESLPPEPDGAFCRRVDKSLLSSLLFDLIRTMNVIVKPFLDTHAKAFDLTLPEWRAMIMLGSWPGISGEDIARRMMMDKMTVSRALRRLEYAGRANRRKLPTDRKIYQWYLTAEGWTAFDQIAEAARHHEENVLCRFSSEDRDQLEKLVRRLMAYAEDDLT
jgi:DNA-binding MarR family transcriptional regulator